MKVIFPKNMQWVKSNNSNWRLYSSEGAFIAHVSDHWSSGWYGKPFDNAVCLPNGPPNKKKEIIETILANNNYYGVKWSDEKHSPPCETK